jgi:hypothetical protein
VIPDSITDRGARAPAGQDAEVQGAEIRHLIIGLYRVLFIVSEQTVFVLHIRHGSRRAATCKEIEAALQESRGQAGEE